MNTNILHTIEEHIQDFYRDHPEFEGEFSGTLRLIREARNDATDKDDATALALYSSYLETVLETVNEETHDTAIQERPTLNNIHLCKVAGW
jgi:hypothetical protein